VLGLSPTNDHIVSMRFTSSATLVIRNGNAITVMYPKQDIVWLTVPILLYGISRMWVKTHRGENARRAGGLRAQ
jgi:hypothetical protein